MKKKRKYWALYDAKNNFIGALRTDKNSPDFEGATSPMGAFQGSVVAPIVPLVVTPEMSRAHMKAIAANIRQWIDCGDHARELSECAARHVMKGLGIPIKGRK